MDSDSQVDNQAFTQFLGNLINEQLDDPARLWLKQKLDLITSKVELKDLYLTFSAIPRFLGKQTLEVSADYLQVAQTLRKGLHIKGWTIPQAARVLTICSYPFQDEQSFVKIMDQLFSAAEVTELVALYSALPVLPYPEALKARASEGVRTNMSVVFDAVVLNNPYPSEYLEEGAWNQMVLKALFMGRPMYQIYGLEHRSNLSLSKMISDFAHERWVAGRPTSPEMWRPIGTEGTISIYQDLEHLLTQEDSDQHAAAVLAARALNTREAQAFLDQHQSVVDQVTEQGTTWDDIGIRWWIKEQQNN